MITPGTLALTALVAVLVVGSKRIRHLGEDLGVALRGFRKGLAGDNEQTAATVESEPPK